MQSEPPLVRLGDAIRYRKEFIRIDDSVVYRRVTARLHAQGIVLRDEIEGSKLRTKDQQICRAGDFLVAEIDAKVGGFGIVPDELEGAIVSSHYFLFEIDQRKLSKKYLEYLIQTAYFQKRITPKGSTNYAAVRPAQVQDLEIFLPPLAEQERVASIVDHNMIRVQEIKRLKSRGLVQAEDLLTSVLERVFSDRYTMKLNEKIEEICTKPQYGYTGAAKQGPVGPRLLRITDVQARKVIWENVPYVLCAQKEKYVLKLGDILIARSGATTGKSYLVESLPYESVFASYLIRIRTREGVLPKYLYYFLQSRRYWSQVTKKTRGCAQPNMNGKKLSSIEVPLPESETIQNRIVLYLNHLYSKVDELIGLQVNVRKDTQKLTSSLLNQILGNARHSTVHDRDHPDIAPASTNFSRPAS